MNFNEAALKMRHQLSQFVQPDQYDAASKELVFLDWVDQFSQVRIPAFAIAQSRTQESLGPFYTRKMIYSAISDLLRKERFVLLDSRRKDDSENEYYIQLLSLDDEQTYYLDVDIQYDTIYLKAISEANSLEPWCSRTQLSALTAKEQIEHAKRSLPWMAEDMLPMQIDTWNQAIEYLFEGTRVNVSLVRAVPLSDTTLEAVLSDGVFTCSVLFTTRLNMVHVLNVMPYESAFTCDGWMLMLENHLQHKIDSLGCCSLPEPPSSDWFWTSPEKLRFWWEKLLIPWMQECKFEFIDVVPDGPNGNATCLVRKRHSYLRFTMHCRWHEKITGMHQGADLELLSMEGGDLLDFTTDIRKLDQCECDEECTF